MVRISEDTWDGLTVSDERRDGVIAAAYVELDELSYTLSETVGRMWFNAQCKAELRAINARLEALKLELLGVGGE